ncbi:PQQ-binding-like beta-propeller repeat protein [Natrinema salinisoli]|uniref:outer membrane protein assembly factor BamB family protein n=1 Tax=Natrinema salinisoli TaxID=2878535 RepID=UPI001CF00557|nr:PQQ-binding-like beta-propeller repeat protein [Natrinema salinisoli]
MSESSPQPTAQEIATECKLTRRRALQSFGVAAGATATGVTFGTDSAQAADGLVDGVVSAIPGASTTEKAATLLAAGNPVGATAVFGALALDSLYGGVESELSADEAILHNVAVSEAQSLNNHEVLMLNRITDSAPIASLEARHGAMLAWENGESNTTGYTNAMGRIRQYYELLEFNDYHAVNKSLLQFGYAGAAATDNGLDAFVAATGTDGSGNTVQFRFRANPTEIDLTLHDGTSISNVDPDEADEVARENGATTLKTPMLHVRDTTNGTDLGTTPVLEQSVVDSWDPDAETLTYDVDGTTCTLESDFVVSSTGDSESQKVWDVAETFHRFDQIVSKSDTVTSRYDQSTVDDLFADLDAGNITPSEVRSPEGVARFLSGTEDQANQQFRLAMFQQLDMVRPDMSRVAEMTVSWSGATGTRVDTDPNLSDRHLYPDEFVDGSQYTGMVFSEQAPSGGFQTGETYTVGPTLYGSTNGGGVEAIEPFSGDFQHNTGHNRCLDLAVSPDQTTLYAATGDPSVLAFDTTTGEQLWAFSGLSGNATSVDISPDGSTVIAGDQDGNSLYGLDPSDGTEKWSHSFGGYVNDCMYSSSNDEAFVAVANGTIASVDPTNDGSENWTYSSGLTLEGIALSPDEETVACGSSGGNVVAVNTADQSEKWSFNTPTATTPDVAADDSAVYAPSYGGIVYCIDITDGTENGQFNPTEDTAHSALTAPGFDDAFIGCAGSIYQVDSSGNGTQFYSGAPDDLMKLVMPRIEFGGVAGVSMTTDDESSSEVILRNGTITIDDMTDREGVSLTHVTDQTIADIEALEATPDSIDTVVSEMGQFDSVDDIKYRKHVDDILENYGALDQRDQISTDQPDYENQQYDTVDNSQFVEYMKNNLESYREMLEAEEESSSSTSDSDDPLFGGIFSDQNGGALAGLAIVALVVMGMVSAAIDKIPLVGK